MPIRTPNRYVKVSCPSCSWHLVVNRGGTGDVLGGRDAAKFLMNQVPEACPRCGGKELQESPAGLWARVNPLAYLRKLLFALSSK